MYVRVYIYIMYVYTHTRSGWESNLYILSKDLNILLVILLVIYFVILVIKNSQM